MPIGTFKCELCKRKFSKPYYPSQTLPRFCGIVCRNRYVAKLKPVHPENRCRGCGKHVLNMANKSKTGLCKDCFSRSDDRNYRWDADKLKILREFYPTRGAEYVARLLQMRVPQVQQRANKMGVRVTPSAYWNLVHRKAQEFILNHHFSSVSKLETRVAKQLHRLGLRFRRQVRMRHWKIDFRVGKTFIEVNGDYWHAHPSLVKEPTPRQKKRIIRDKRLAAHCRNHDIPLIVIWEHEVNANDFSKLETLLTKRALA